jgi:hypothetical protein
MTTADPGGQANVPEGLVASVVDLVGTGPVLLGAYTIAELTAVDAVVDFLEARPPDDVLAEAVRSLAARELLVAGDESDQMQVRGDLGIAVAFQQRARLVLDARVQGTDSGEPWRTLVLPQPEPICLVIRVDALGVHELGLYPMDHTLDRLAEWLPSGNLNGSAAVDASAVLASADRSALVTASHYTALGSAETVSDSTDLILARQDGHLHAFARDPADVSRLVPRVLVHDNVRDTLADLLGHG